MGNTQPSDTFKKLYFDIIDDLFSQISNANINYCLKIYPDNTPVQIVIWQKFEEYKKKALSKMSGERLDRHKLASCICGAIIEVKPLIGYNGAIILKKANESLALHVGLNVIKFYMVYNFLNKLDVLPEEKNNIKHYLYQNFNMQFPNNICDTQQYKDNFVNALLWSHEKCEISKKECFTYDIWAYSKLFFHLELYNKEYMKKSYEEFMKIK